MDMFDCWKMENGKREKENRVRSKPYSGLMDVFNRGGLDIPMALDAASLYMSMPGYDDRENVSNIYCH